MQISEIDKKYEVERLNRVCKIIDTNIEIITKYLENVKGELISTNKLMWENTAHSSDDFDKVVEIKQFLDELKQQNDKQMFFKKKMTQMEKLKKSPYFARVDFLEEDDEYIEEVYIGISTLFHNNDILIYDWRAPISSIFYEYEMGSARYNCPDGVIKGEILLKRQFKISEDRINYMFNTDVKIDDDILQEVLSRNVDNKMRTIITSIQKEQNRIIRNEESSVLMVQGPAGSGKTSIALHRAAYLLYRFRDTLTANDIIIFSPNKIFSSYISNILPELGEENIRQTSFLDFTKDFFKSHIRLEDYNYHIEKLLCNHDKKREDEIRFKSSEAFVELLKNYISFLQDTQISFPDIAYNGEVIISKKEIWDLYNNSYKAFPYAEKLKLIRQRLFTIVEKYEGGKVKNLTNNLEKESDYANLGYQEVKIVAKSMVKREVELLKSKIMEFTKYDSFLLYKDLFKNNIVFEKVSCGINFPADINDIRKRVIERINRNEVSYDDIAPIVYLKYSLENVKKKYNIKHVIIDEAQDYSPIQYQLLFEYFKNSNITILGDTNQIIHFNYNIGTFEEIATKKDNSLVVTLNKSYRSTKEITQFAQGILCESKEYDIVSRPGEKPKIIECKNEDKLIEKIVSDINVFKENKIQSIAIVCKTNLECQRVYNMLKEKIDVNIVKSEDAEFPKGIIIIPSYLIKGLEYDAVLIYNADDKSFYMEKDRKIFYTICTRPLHYLRIYYTKAPFSYLKDIDKDLYIFEADY
ncbi:UNVERIFIED_CONTAM: DNA helicase-2/ATP-dependent DNA helicase PcrA [Acetivibrio alkalicellulosi]